MDGTLMGCAMVKVLMVKLMLSKQGTGTMVIAFPKSSRHFKFSVLYPNRVYYYFDDWNRDFFELPKGKWSIIEINETKTSKSVTFKQT
jgi:hypothetical protein